MENNIIDLIAQGNASAAKEAITQSLSNKSFEALDYKKREIAQSLYRSENPEQNLETEDNIETA
jgi:hypothetical protein